jgi:peptidoglycan/LPS O-acetylase OafA/YrhL
MPALTTTSPSRPHRERFILLDGLRGIAALFIIQRHATALLGEELPSSYLGVDLFFGLSGFVLAHAYGEALRDRTISPAAFMKARFARLYPLYGLGVMLMAAYFVCLYVTGQPTPLDDLHRKIDPVELAIAIVTGLLFIPAPFSLTLNGALFLVHPAWSLFNELVANLFYGFRGARASVTQVVAILIVSACVLVIAAFQFEKLHAGFRWNEMHAGMARVFFSFFAGVLIYRYRSRSPQLAPYRAMMCLLFVMAVLAFPTPKDLRAVFDLPIVLFAWPALLFVASATVPGRLGSAVSSFLGTASYAIYVLHVPLLAWTELVLPEMAMGKAAPFVGVGFILLLTVLCWYLTVKLYQPLQRLLKQRLLGSRPIP